MNKYWIALLLLTSMPALAVAPYAATPAEQAMCQARVYSRLGVRDQNTMHMHHYCDGLRFLDRAYAIMKDKREMHYNLNRSIGNFDYVLSHTQENFSMRGEVHVGKARALKLMGKRAEAVSEYHKALRYSLESPDVYVALADHYQETGNKAKALEMATEGLRRNPDSKGLKRRYTELGGTLPYPAPIAPAMVEEQAAKPVDTTASTPSMPAEPTQNVPETVTPVAEPLAPPKIGSPKNPYCRFCPD